MNMGSVVTFAKKRSLSILISIIIIFLILLIYTWYKINKLYNNFYEGLWVASDSFCEQSEISGMLIYIGPKNKQHKGYLIMYSNNTIIVNKKFSIKFPTFGTYIKIYDTDDDTIPFEEIMPLDMKINIDISNGRMIWEDSEGIVYADLYKDNIGTKYGKTE